MAWYVLSGMTFFETSWSFRSYGRLSMIFFEYASPIPGKALSSSAEAVLMSNGVFLVSDVFASALVAAAGGAFLACAKASGPAARGPSNSRAVVRAISRVIMCLLLDTHRRGELLTLSSGGLPRGSLSGKIGRASCRER